MRFKLVCLASLYSVQLNLTKASVSNVHFQTIRLASFFRGYRDLAVSTYAKATTVTANAGSGFLVIYIRKMG